MKMNLKQVTLAGILVMAPAMDGKTMTFEVVGESQD